MQLFAGRVQDHAPASEEMGQANAATTATATARAATQEESQRAAPKGSHAKTTADNNRPLTILRQHTQHTCLKSCSHRFGPEAQLSEEGNKCTGRGRHAPASEKMGQAYAATTATATARAANQEESQNRTGRS